MRDQTIRQDGRASIGGSRVRIVVSNEYGKQPITIGAAHVALAGAESNIVAGSDRNLTFSGQGSITVPPGAPAISDPVDLQVPA
ncbi:MAG: SGNH/GDSL hydrolase family protein, partial [Hyphomicrobiales bacterium]|nr:SGNH/GDSL hydrolase family protein [Hyphomicrobiales bacterium]